VILEEMEPFHSAQTGPEAQNAFSAMDRARVAAHQQGFMVRCLIKHTDTFILKTFQEMYISPETVNYRSTVSPI
jgi:hypothetical protein